RPGPFTVLSPGQAGRLRPVAPGHRILGYFSNLHKAARHVKPVPCAQGPGTRAAGDRSFPQDRRVVYGPRSLPAVTRAGPARGSALVALEWATRGARAGTAEPPLPARRAPSSKSAIASPLSRPR